MNFYNPYPKYTPQGGQPVMPEPQGPLQQQPPVPKPEGGTTTVPKFEVPATIRVASNGQRTPEQERNRQQGLQAAAVAKMQAMQSAENFESAVQQKIQEDLQRMAAENGMA